MSLEARGSSRWSRFSPRDHGFAILVTTAALLIHLAIYPYGRSTPFLLFFGAVMLSGWKGGWGPGLLSTGLSALLVDYFFLPPHGSLSLAPQDLLSVVLFAVISTVITWLNVRERSARLEAQAQRERLQSLFMQAPAIIAIHRGPEHVYEFSNTMNSQVLGHRELLGRPVRQAQPELEG
ncbi:MAG TPA: DUF4118 domain-containing protein, partial [Cystobacter sp.]